MQDITRALELLKNIAVDGGLFSYEELILIYGGGAV